jgi:polyisoprenoid-binding protein YceI
MRAFLLHIKFRQIEKICRTELFMKNFFAFITIILTGCSTVLHAQDAIMRSAVTFEIKNLGIATGGSIGGLITKAHFTPANLTASTLEASVDVNTINTDNSSRDEHLRSADFFDVARYPKITLKSIAFKHKSGSNYSGTFILTIKGRSKQIEIPFTFVDKENTIEFKGTFKINRLDFGIGSESVILANDVVINIDCAEKSQGPV